MIDLKSIDVINLNKLMNGKILISEEDLKLLESLIRDLRDKKSLYSDIQSRIKALAADFSLSIDQKKTLGVELRKESSTLNNIIGCLEDDLKQKASVIPNLPSAIVPVGISDKDNVVINLFRSDKIKVKTDLTKSHDEILAECGWIDFDNSVKMSGKRFSTMKSYGAKLERVLKDILLEKNIQAGFLEMSTPYMVTKDSMYATGQLPKFEKDLFQTKEGMFLIPTAEVSLVNFYRDTIIKDLSSPIRLTAATPCFRAEAGAAGMDSKGIIRQHQFHKVELVSICKPEDSESEFDAIINHVTSVLMSCNIPFRTVMLCTGDLGFSASKTIDFEVWMPFQNCYREISSVSLCSDFQSRRASIKFKQDKENCFAHTLNGSCLPIGRLIASIVENFQDENGKFDEKGFKDYIDTVSDADEFVNHDNILVISNNQPELEEVTIEAESFHLHKQESEEGNMPASKSNLNQNLISKQVMPSSKSNLNQNLISKQVVPSEIPLVAPPLTFRINSGIVSVEMWSANGMVGVIPPEELVKLISIKCRLEKDSVMGLIKHMIPRLRAHASKVGQIRIGELTPKIMADAAFGWGGFHSSLTDKIGAELLPVFQEMAARAASLTPPPKKK